MYYSSIPLMFFLPGYEIPGKPCHSSALLMAYPVYNPKDDEFLSYVIHILPPS